MKKQILMLGLLFLAQSALADDCGDIQFTGRFQSNGFAKRTLHAKQDGCQVTIVEDHNKATWIFDLTAKTVTTLPNQVIQSNRDTDLGRAAFPSVKLATNSENLIGYPERGFSDILIQGTMNLPAVAPNEINVKLLMDMHLWISNDSARTFEGEKMTFPTLERAKRVDRIFLKKASFRVIEVRDSLLPGPLGAAFARGANFVLKFLDGRHFEHLTDYTRILED